MDRAFYQQLSERSIAGEILPHETCREILDSPDLELLPLLDAAYTVRKKFHGNEVMVHIINNAQNGHCPEDCHYCAQARTSQADIEDYPLKPDEEIIAEAKNAYEKGAYRYCMVFAGRAPSPRRTDHLARLIRAIKSRYPIEVCVSAGLLDEKKARILKEAGLDRLNHNLNTTEKNYPSICTTHTYADRIKTLRAAKDAGLELCSGVIVGMGESHDDLIGLAKTLREFAVPSIPVNFLVPIEGNTIMKKAPLTPAFCLRVLCLFRFLNPRCELRVAAGREIHLRGMEVMALYPANSLFLDGYLNTKGAHTTRTLGMIKDAGFTLNSHQNLDDLLQKAKLPPAGYPDHSPSIMKGLKELRPHFVAQEKDS